MNTRTLVRRITQAALLVSGLLIAACHPLPPSQSGKPAAVVAAPAATPIPGGTLHHGLTLPVSGIDPHVNAGSELGIALNGVYDTLVVQDRDGQFHSSLAESWTVSEDGRAYTFRLRQDVTSTTARRSTRRP